MKYTLLFDTETGGLNCKNSDLLTVYFVMLDDTLQVVDELDLKLKPNDGRLPIADAGALKVNGINLQAHLADPETVSYSDAKVLLVAFLKKYLKKSGRYSNIRPMGQNVGYDIGFTQEHILPKDEWDSIVHYAIIDTKAIVDFLKDCGWFPRDLGSLGSIVEFLGIPKRNAHTAKDDSLMALDVYKKILEIMNSKREGGQSADLISLLESE